MDMRPAKDARPPTGYSGRDRANGGGVRSNVRTGLILVSIAAAFFAGVVIRHWPW
jgi:hypothetical protein